MQNSLDNGKNHNTNIVIMGGQYDLCNCWVNLCKCVGFCIYFVKFIGCFYKPNNFLSMMLTYFAQSLFCFGMLLEVINVC